MRQIAGAGVLLAVTAAAIRLAGGPQTAGLPPAVAGSKGGVRSTISSRMKGRPLTPYKGGCSAFLPEEKSENYPKDGNRGTAKAVIDHFFSLVGKPDGDGSDGDLSPLKGETHVRYAIALAPDPRHTNLSLLFDREMVSIQQSAQDEGYNYNSSWLPWRNESSTFPLYADEQRSADETEDRESCPGILLFRESVSGRQADLDAEWKKNHPQYTGKLPDAYEKALVVLVVGEQPTGGLNEDQWANAMVWLNGNASLTESPPRPLFDRQNKLLPDSDRALYLLGPTFSGSLVSLQRDLDRIKPTSTPAKDVSFPSAATPVRILSGSVSGCSSALWFQKQLSGTGNGNTVFGSFHENDEVQIYRLLNYLDQQGTDPKDVAILSEDETAYAAAFTPAGALQPPPKTSPNCDFPYARGASPVRLSYPRDISALRTAYERESVFSKGSDRSAHPILQESDALSGEPSNASDTIRSFGGAISPIAQEAVLYGIVSHLRSHHSGYIILRCTNPLDFLFLTRFFHRAYPEARIVTVGADLLFRREIDTTEFRGVLALSNYPLLPRDQHWAALSTMEPGAPFPPHTHRTPESHFEGVYLAGRYLFGDVADLPVPSKDASQPLTLPFKPNLPDFADPFWMHKPDGELKTIQAPTWLSVVGRDGYWPLAVLNDDSVPKQCLERELEGSSKNRCDSKGPVAGDLSKTLVRLDSTGKAPLRPHYDLDSNGTDRFYSTLLLKMHLSWQICAVCATFLLCYQVFGVWWGGRFASMGLFALFRPARSASQSILLGINCALAASILLELLLLAVALPEFDGVFGNGYGFTWIIALCAAILTAICIWAGLFLLRRPGGRGMIALAVVSLWLICEWATVPEAKSFGGTALSSLGDLFSGTRMLALFASFLIWLSCAMLCRLLADRSSRDRATAAIFCLSLGVIGALLYVTIHARLTPANRLPIFYRITHLTSGVSPTLPILFLLAGFYLWTWQALAGNTLLCYGRPLLPDVEVPLDTDSVAKEESKQRWSQRMFSEVAEWYGRLLVEPTENRAPGAEGIERRYYRISQEFGLRIVRVANPLCFDFGIIVFPLSLAIGAAAYLGTMGPPLLSLDGHAYDKVLNGLLLFAFLITIAEAGRLFVTWKELQRLLIALNRTRLRRTFAKLRAIESSSLWSVSGSVQRIQFHFFAQQLDAARRLCLLNRDATKSVVAARDCGDDFSKGSADKVNTGAPWEDWRQSSDGAEAKKTARIREVLNAAVTEVMRDLIKSWKTEKESLNFGAPAKNSKSSEDDTPDDSTTPSRTEGGPGDEEAYTPLVRTQEEFVCFHYISFIQNILGRMRTMVLSMTFLFVAVCFAISFYPFVPRTGISIWMIVNLVLLSASVVYVYAGLERDETLSHITNTDAGRLGGEFYMKVAGFLAGPLIGLLTAQFPAVSESFLSWLQPGLDALK